MTCWDDPFSETFSSILAQHKRTIHDPRVYVKQHDVQVKMCIYRMGKFLPIPKINVLVSAPNLSYPRR